MSYWIKIATTAECPPGAALEVVAGDRILALFNVDGVYHALDGVCPHQGGPLGKGALTGSTITCPWHGWQFNVCSGRHLLNARLTQPGYPARAENGEVWVDLGADGQSSGNESQAANRD